MRYPIIEETQLGEVRRRWLRRARRDMQSLPQQQPGTVLVFQINNGYEIAPGHRLRGDEPVVVNAASVSVVNVRQQKVPVTIALPSANPANAFQVVVTFGCRVYDAKLVVETHGDLLAELKSYLRQDRELRALSSRYPLEDLTEARTALSAQIEARFSLKPLELDGVDITLGDVEVLTPDDLVAFERSRQEVGRRQFLETMHRDFDRTEALLIEEILERGPLAVEALAIRLGEINVANATARSYGEADKATARLVELLSNLADTGQIDQVPVDTPMLIDKLVARITGRSDSVTYRDGHTEQALPLESRPAPRQSRIERPDTASEWRGGNAKPQEVDDDL